MIRARHNLGQSADSLICLALQCGAFTQADVGQRILWECTQLGFRGMKSCTDPICQQFGGCAARFQASSLDVQPDDPSWYENNVWTLPMEPTVELDPYRWVGSQPAAEPEPGELVTVACATDVKVCADGTVLTRQPPMCLFPACPEVEAPPPAGTNVYEPPPDELELDLEPLEEQEEPAEPTNTEQEIQTTTEDGSEKLVVGKPGTEPENPFQGLLVNLSYLESKLPTWAQGYPWYYWLALIVGSSLLFISPGRKRRRR